jgi:hypothetical protein
MAPCDARVWALHGPNTQTPHKKFLAPGPWWIVSVESYAFSVFTGKRGCLLINREI